jgi:nitrate reductase NapAB chaperone NapD
VFRLNNSELARSGTCARVAQSESGGEVESAPFLNSLRADQTGEIFSGSAKIRKNGEELIMIVSAVVAAKADKTAAVEGFLKTFKEIKVHSVKDNELLIIIDAEDEFIENLSNVVLKKDDIISFLPHSYHFI